jgi:hypothetical protein
LLFRWTKQSKKKKKTFFTVKNQNNYTVKIAMESTAQKKVKAEKSLKQKEQLKKYAESSPSSSSNPIMKVLSLTKTDL